MNDVLLSVGTVCQVRVGNDLMNLMVIGKRQIEDNGIQMIAWDYQGVPFPEGVTGRFIFFNHYQIEKVLADAPKIRKLFDVLEVEPVHQLSTSGLPYDDGEED